jgi:hypothetical protein
VRTRYKYDKELGKVVEADSYQREGDFHYVQDDTMAPTLSHATTEGLVFDSKSALREHYKANGMEISGGGHLRSASERKRDYEDNRKRRRAEIRETVAEQLEKGRWGMAKMTEKEKFVCRQEEKDYKRYKRENNLE